MESKAIVLGEYPKIHGALMNGITHSPLTTPLKTNKSIRLHALELLLMKISNTSLTLFLMNISQMKIYQPNGTGEMFLESIISPSLEINTYPIIVEVVGLLQLQVP